MTRLQPGATGNVHFSMTSFLSNQAHMNDSLVNGPYADVALVPATPWLDAPPPPVPSVQLETTRNTSSVVLGTYGKLPPWQWYVQWHGANGWRSTLLSGDVSTVPVPADGSATSVTVRAINRVGVESPPISLPLTDAAGDSGRAVDRTNAPTRRRPHVQ